MCKFLSALVLKTGEVLCIPGGSDSHEDLIEHFELSDKSRHIQHFVRVEFSPPNNTPLYEVDKYELRVDEKDTPKWFEKHRDKVERNLYRRVKKMLVSGKKKCLVGGCYILYGKAKVEKVVNVVIKAMYDSSRVGWMYDSSQIGWMYDSSRVGGMWDSSRVEGMGGSSQVGEMHDSSRVGEMYDSSQVGEMYDSSRVGRMLGSSRVEKMHHSSQVKEMNDSSQVGEMYSSSQVGVMYSSSRVVEDLRKKE